MSDGDRGSEPATLGAFGYFSAIALCCIIVGSLAYGLGRENERRYEIPASYAMAAKADAQRACVDPKKVASFECIYEKVQASQEQARGEEDLRAQQKAANSALLSTIISFLALIVTGAGVWFVKRTLEATLEAVEDTGKATVAMQEANEIARDGMEKQLRAYVHPESFRYVPQPDHTNQNFGWGFAIHWKNSGITPAQFASMLIWVEVVDGALPEDFQFDRTADDHVPVVFGPNMPVTSAYACVSADDIKKFFAAEKALYLWGWVKYRDVFPASPERQTRFCYRLSVNGDPTKASGPDNNVHWMTAIHVNHNSAT